MKTALVALATALSVAVSPVMAQQVLYCVDTDSTGFKWDKDGKVRQRSFAEERYTVKVLSDTKRVIKRSDSDVVFEFTCRRLIRGRTTCDQDGLIGGETWVFYRTTYTRAFMVGPPAGGLVPIITIAYGTCTGF